jgi:hypothetical protein
MSTKPGQAHGAVHRERVFLKANRVGGAACAAWELTAHLTGMYPTWWTGARFARPVKTWAAGDTMLTTRDIVQVELGSMSRNAITVI